MKNSLLLFSVALLEIGIFARAFSEEEDSSNNCEDTIKKAEEDFRDYDHAPQHVRDFYHAQHAHQTYAFAKDQRAQLEAIMGALRENHSEATLKNLEDQGQIRRMSLWQAVEELDKLIDQSDPDLALPNSIHALQSAEAIRVNIDSEELDWMILVGLLHDIGKVDALLRQVPQWAVVGDTFPVGCAFSEKNIFADFFKLNPDAQDPALNTLYGIYNSQAGLDNLIMSWGHDEYAYRVLKDQGLLPKEALSMIRFHSFYPLHREGAYLHLINPKQDDEQIEWVKKFNPFDLYSKSPVPPNKADLASYYKKLINKYFPPSEGESEKKLIWPVLRAVEK